MNPTPHLIHARFAGAMFLVLSMSATASTAVGQGTPVAKPETAATAPQSGTRTIYLLRHGQYDQHDPRSEQVGKGLTELGREQARRAGARFAGLPVKVNAVYASPLTRARESAEIAPARSLNLIASGRAISRGADWRTECWQKQPHQSTLWRGNSRGVAGA